MPGSALVGEFYLREATVSSSVWILVMLEKIEKCFGKDIALAIKSFMA